MRRICQAVGQSEFQHLCEQLRAFSTLLQQAHYSNPGSSLIQPCLQAIRCPVSNTCYLLMAPAIPVSYFLAATESNPTPPSVATRLQLISCLVAGLDFLHSNGIAHGRINSSSVLFRHGHSDLRPLLGGYPYFTTNNHSLSSPAAAATSSSPSSSNDEDHRLETGIDTANGIPWTIDNWNELSYLAPEHYRPPSSEHPQLDLLAADIYSLGLVCYRLLFWSSSPSSFKSQHDALAAAHLLPRSLRSKPRPPEIPAALLDLVLACLNPDPSQRPKSPNMVAIVSNILLAPLNDDPLAESFWRDHCRGLPFVFWTQFSTAFLDFCAVEPATRERAYHSLLAVCLSLKFGDQVPTTESQDALPYHISTDRHTSTSSSSSASITETSSASTTRSEIVISSATGEHVLLLGPVQHPCDLFITFKMFRDLLDWFGPLARDDFFESLANVLRKDWFHGNLSGTQAEQKLRSEAEGTYLFRFSATDPGSYAISVRSKNPPINHYRVYHKPDLGFLVGKVECKSLDEVLYRFKRDLALQRPLSHTPYEHLFRGSSSQATPNSVSRYTALLADSDDE